MPTYTTYDTHQNVTLSEKLPIKTKKVYTNFWLFSASYKQKL